MGYDLYITRGASWCDEAREPITLGQWEACVASDPELRFQGEMGVGFAVWSGPSRLDGPWIAYSEGNLYSKKPDAQLIEKMTAVAALLGARVVGEEGESYLAGGEVRRTAPPSLWRRFKGRLSGVLSRGAEPVDPATLPFRVGDRVRDFLGRVAVVERIDTRAEHGLGVIDLRYENGTVSSFSVVAHGLEPFEQRQ
jgi:hypothetical protein